MLYSLFWCILLLWRSAPYPAGKHQTKRQYQVCNTHPNSIILFFLLLFFPFLILHHSLGQYQNFHFCWKYFICRTSVRLHLKFRPAGVTTQVFNLTVYSNHTFYSAWKNEVFPLYPPHIWGVTINKNMEGICTENAALQTPLVHHKYLRCWGQNIGDIQVHIH